GDDQPSGGGSPFAKGSRRASARGDMYERGFEDGARRAQNRIDDALANGQQVTRQSVENVDPDHDSDLYLSGFEAGIEFAWEEYLHTASRRTANEKPTWSKPCVRCGATVERWRGQGD